VLRNSRRALRSKLFLGFFDWEKWLDIYIFFGVNSKITKENVYIWTFIRKKSPSIKNNHLYISRFLSENAFRAIDREALWSALPTFVDHGAEEERLSTVMEGWLLNEGMPEVIIR
jgi:hypothetical protein